MKEEKITQERDRRETAEYRMKRLDVGQMNLNKNTKSTGTKQFWGICGIAERKGRKKRDKGSG
jgi:hypothetical protein